jgi:hypothetical protein
LTVAIPSKLILPSNITLVEQGKECSPFGVSISILQETLELSAKLASFRYPHILELLSGGPGGPRFARKGHSGEAGDLPKSGELGKLKHAPPGIAYDGQLAVNHHD